MQTKKTELSSTTLPPSTSDVEVSMQVNDVEQRAVEQDNEANEADLFRAIFKNSDSETSDDSSKEDSQEVQVFSGMKSIK